MGSVGGRVYRFGDFLLDVEERVLSRDGQSLPLAPKTFDLLVILVEHGGHLVTKETLLRDVWSGAFVEENTLNRSISVLRKTLGEGKYIETVPKHGYRFVAPIIGTGETDYGQIVESHTSTLIISEEE